jgi:hypothetical protein
VQLKITVNVMTCCQNKYSFMCAADILNMGTKIAAITANMEKD